MSPQYGCSDSGREPLAKWRDLVQCARRVSRKAFHTRSRNSDRFAVRRDTNGLLTPVSIGLGTLERGVHDRRLALRVLAGLVWVAQLVHAQNGAHSWDTFSDTWVAADALGRVVPTHAEVGPPRPDRTVGIFYFLWHGAHIQGGPYDISKILSQNPRAMTEPDSPLWGPLHAPHHWGEPVFGYYLTQDESVLRKHAQMLSDAGIDVVIFDVTNQITYKDDYMTLLRVWSGLRALGNITPQVAFLCPFWNPSKVVHELWRDLYSVGLFSDLWFRWNGKPLILADPALVQETISNERHDIAVELRPEHSLGQSFLAPNSLDAVGGCFPTWNTTGSCLTLTLYRDGPGGELVARERFTNVRDNEWCHLHLKEPVPPGRYYLEATDPQGRIGWWSHTSNTFAGSNAFVDGQPVAGSRTCRIRTANSETSQILAFFTFRKPQPDYFRGQTVPDQWSWLEVYPQHVFTNSAGQKEQMSVGVAQNAVGNRLGCMSELGARGRSFHDGATDPRPNAVRYGLNFSEQWERALVEDPRFIFVTGWNEWIAGRFAEFNGVKLPVMFVDQFDQEHSRDIEPMHGGHGDDYYYQLVSYVRRYKGARPITPVKPTQILIDARFDEWCAVEPEFRDTIGDPVHRKHRGWDKSVIYENHTGRNDIVAAKVSFDSEFLYAYVRTREPLTPPHGTNWMVFLLDIDENPTNNWLGYDVRVNATRSSENESNVDVWESSNWRCIGRAKLAFAQNELELGIPWSTLALKQPPARIDFKWTDNCFSVGDWTDFTLNGDAAPNDRFNFRAVLRRLH